VGGLYCGGRRGAELEPITQGLLGAAVGRVCAGRLGRRALLWGALVGVLPDLDIVLAPLRGGYGEMLYHRGSSHALWFGWVVGPPLGWALWRWQTPNAPELLRCWQRLCVLALVTHPLLDVFTPYGTQLFAPFWRHRFALHSIGIVDPFYTLLLALPMLGAALRGRRAGRGESAAGPGESAAPARSAGRGRRAALVGLGESAARGRRAAVVGLALSTAYLLCGVGLNAWARADVRAALAAPEGAAPAAPEALRVYPSLLQPLLRRAVGRDEGRVYVGWHTPLRPGCPKGRWFREPPATAALQKLRASWQGALFHWFALGEVSHYSTALPGGGVRASLEDLRYGGLRGPPQHGIWGVRADFDAAGRRIGPIERFQRRDFSQLGLGELFRAALGDLRGVAGEMPPGCAGSPGG